MNWGDIVLVALFVVGGCVALALVILIPYWLIKRVILGLRWILMPSRRGTPLGGGGGYIYEGTGGSSHELSPPYR